MVGFINEKHLTNDERQLTMSTRDPLPQSHSGSAPVTVDLHETGSTEPSTVILETVLSLSGKAVTELGCLGESVDLDALDKLFPYSAAATLGASVEFVVDDYQVTVRDDGLIRFEDCTDC